MFGNVCSQSHAYGNQRYSFFPDVHIVFSTLDFYRNWREGQLVGWGGVSPPTFKKLIRNDPPIEIYKLTFHPFLPPCDGYGPISWSDMRPPYRLVWHRAPSQSQVREGTVTPSSRQETNEPKSGARGNRKSKPIYLYTHSQCSATLLLSGFFFCGFPDSPSRRFHRSLRCLQYTSFFCLDCEWVGVGSKAETMYPAR